MLIGIVVGLKFFPEKYNDMNGKFQILCIAMLIFSMGVSLGKRPQFFEELSSLGIKSLVLAVIPVILSILFVYILTKKFIGDKDDSDSNN